MTCRMTHTRMQNGQKEVKAPATETHKSHICCTAKPHCQELHASQASYFYRGRIITGQLLMKGSGKKGTIFNARLRHPTWIF